MEITHFFGLFLKLNFSYSFLRVTISLLKIFRLRRYSFLRVTISLDQIVIIFVTQIAHFFGLPFLRERTVSPQEGIIGLLRSDNSVLDSASVAQSYNQPEIFPASVPLPLAP